MRVRLLLLSVVAVLGLSGAVIGPSGALIDRALLPLGGALQANASAGAECTADALVDYDARTLSTGVLSDWANSGSGGSAWDATQATSDHRPTVLASASCEGASENCVHFIDANDHMDESGVASATWTERFFCLLYYSDFVGDNYLYTWTPGDGDNRLADTATLKYLLRGTANAFNIGTITADWHTICVDVTDGSSATVYQNGVSVASGVDIGTVADPAGFVLANPNGAAGSLGAAGTKFGRFLAWNGAHCSAADIDAELKAQWGL